MGTSAASEPLDFFTRLAFKKLRTIAWRFTVIKEELF